MSEYGLIPRLKEIASLYVLNGKVIKCRGKQKQDVTGEDIISAIENKDRVVIEKNGVINCYFKDEYMYILESVMNTLINNVNFKVVVNK